MRHHLALGRRGIHSQVEGDQAPPLTPAALHVSARISWWEPVRLDAADKWANRQGTPALSRTVVECSERKFILDSKPRSLSLPTRSGEIVCVEEGLGGQAGPPGASRTRA